MRNDLATVAYLFRSEYLHAFPISTFDILLPNPLLPCQHTAGYIHQVFKAHGF